MESEKNAVYNFQAKMFVLILLAMIGNGVAGQTLDTSSLAEFTVHFRKILLEEVAYGVNVTVNMTETLKVMIDECKPKMDDQTSRCKSCTQAACQKSPTFEDYLKLANPYLHLKEPLDAIGNKLNDAVDLIQDEAGGFYNSLKGLGNSIGNFPDEAAEIFNNLKNELGKFEDYFKDLGDIIINTGDLVKDFLDDIFGKRRRRRAISGSELSVRDLVVSEAILRAIIERKLEQRANIDADVRACMEQCSSCTPLLLPTEKEIIQAVCGEEIILMNNTIQAKLKKILTAYNNAVDKVNPIVKQVILNIASLDYTTYTLSDVKITVYLDESYTEYQTGTAYPLLNMALGAKQMGLEYWEKITVTTPDTDVY